MNAIFVETEESRNRGKRVILFPCFEIRYLMCFGFQEMLFYHSYSYEHPSPHDTICTMARGMAAWTFAREHPYTERNRNLHLAKTWKKNFNDNWHIHARICEQALRKVVQLQKVDITVEETDLAFCIFKYRSMFAAALKQLVTGFVSST
jgi:hypothetical protein